MANEEQLLGILRQVATVTVFPAFLVRRLFADGGRHNGGTSTMKVRDIMTTDVRACLPDEPLSAAVRIMWDCDCGIAPVVDRSGRVVGAITDRDICIACWSRDARPSEVLVSETMTREVQCCGADDTVADAERAIRACQVRRLPVVDDEGRLQGIISLADITLAADGRIATMQAGELHATEVVQVLADVCQPHHGGPSAATIASQSASATTSQQRPVE